MPDVELHVEGHTSCSNKKRSSIGTKFFKQHIKLSHHRAKTVLKALIKFGVPKKQLSASSSVRETHTPRAMEQHASPDTTEIRG